VHATVSGREEAALDRSRELKPEAYEAYLRGRYLWNRRTADGLAKSIDYFKLAADLEPTFAEAHSGLADAYALSGDWEYGLLAPQDAFGKARAEATKALALDDNLSDAHTSLAFVLDLYAWDWRAAEQEYERAILLNPGYATAHQWYAWHLIVLGRIADGIAELRRAENLDPLSAIIGADLADALCIAHLYEDAVWQSRKTLELHPNFAVAYYQMGQAFAQQNKSDEAIAAFQRAIDLSGGNTAFEANLAHAYAVSGRKNETMKIVKDLEAQRTRSPSTNANIALIYVGLNDGDQAIAWLEKAYEARFNPSILMRPGFDPIRSDPRFQSLLRRIGISDG
jgi:tetratricopeptide (TPR) repeat protein